MMITSPHNIRSVSENIHLIAMRVDRHAATEQVKSTPTEIFSTKKVNQDWVGFTKHALHTYTQTHTQRPTLTCPPLHTMQSPIGHIWSRDSNTATITGSLTTGVDWRCWWLPLPFFMFYSRKSLQPLKTFGLVTEGVCCCLLFNSLGLKVIACLCNVHYLEPIWSSQGNEKWCTLYAPCVYNS